MPIEFELTKRRTSLRVAVALLFPTMQINEEKFGGGPTVACIAFRCACNNGGKPARNFGTSSYYPQFPEPHPMFTLMSQECGTGLSCF